MCMNPAQPSEIFQRAEMFIALLSSKRKCAVQNSRTEGKQFHYANWKKIRRDHSPNEFLSSSLLRHVIEDLKKAVPKVT